MLKLTRPVYEPVTETSSSGLSQTSPEASANQEQAFGAASPMVRSGSAGEPDVAVAVAGMVGDELGEELAEVGDVIALLVGPAELAGVAAPASLLHAASASARRHNAEGRRDLMRRRYCVCRQADMALGPVFHSIVMKACGRPAGLS